MTPPVAAAHAARPAAIDFELPAELEATEPPELRGRGRDDVRLLVARRGDATVRHLRFADIVDVLEPGDLLVVNTSGTRPAALPARRADGARLRLHLSTRLPGGLWLVELRQPTGIGSTPFAAGQGGETLHLPAGATAELLTPYSSSRRLWVGVLHLPARSDLASYLAVHGEPIRYRYSARAWPLAAYQTVYATEAGSAEMPSAGRPFTPEIITRLVAKGVGVAPVVLHTGVSSAEAHEAPYPEYYRVPAATARWVDGARAAGGRVLAVGTTVVRALETVADDAGGAHPGEGWTEVVIGPDRPTRVVDGILTGWHEPSSSHLQLLEALAGPAVLAESYREAVAGRYRWHEFGDVHLILP